MPPREDFYVWFVCPHCYRSKWTLKRNLEMSLEEVLNTFWDFECPVDGALREKPLQARPKKRFREDMED